MPRARAIAITRRREPTPWLPWLFLLAALTAGIAAAQARSGAAAFGVSDAQPSLVLR